MTLEEMLAEAKRRWPKKDINCARYMSYSNGRDEEWWHLSINDIGKFNNRSLINGSSPEDALSKVVLPDRISEARMMIEKANEILLEEGVIPAVSS